MHSGGVDYVDQEPWETPTVFIRQTFARSEIAVNLPENISDFHYISQAILGEEEEDDDDRMPLEAMSEVRRIPYFLASLFCALLEDSLVQVRCLQQCNYTLKIVKTLADEKHLKALKFNIKTVPVEDELEGINKDELDSTINKVRKLDADRIYVHDVLLNLYLELAFKFTGNSLRDCIQMWNNRVAYRSNLEADEEKNKITRKELAKQVRQQRNHFKSAIYDSDLTIENLKSQVEDFILISETASRYVVNWEVARTEQHLKTIENKEYGPMRTVDYYKQRYEHEIRVHNEIELLVNIVINESLAKVEEWMDKYDRDMEKMDLNIELRKHNYYDMRDRRLKMEETIAKRNKLMKDWIHYKDEREKLRLYKEKMNNAATVVQAWWRGLLVRLKLGPYKVKKKKKEKKT